MTSRAQRYTPGSSLSLGPAMLSARDTSSPRSFEATPIAHSAAASAALPASPPKAARAAWNVGRPCSRACSWASADPPASASERLTKSVASLCSTLRRVRSAVPSSRVGSSAPVALGHGAVLRPEAPRAPARARGASRGRGVERRAVGARLPAGHDHHARRRRAWREPSGRGRRRRSERRQQTHAHRGERKRERECEAAAAVERQRQRPKERHDKHGGVCVVCGGEGGARGGGGEGRGWKAR